jgi:hypothetical protein
MEADGLSRALICSAFAARLFNPLQWATGKVIENMKSLWLPLILLMLCGCATKKRPSASFIIPNRCLRVKIADFQKPCRAISGSVALCDQVQIHYSCVEVVK